MRTIALPTDLPTYSEFDDPDLDLPYLKTAFTAERPSGRRADLLVPFSG